jgi:hypothetical protein
MALTVQDGQSNDTRIASYIENGITNCYDVIVVQLQTPQPSGRLRKR